MSRSSLRALAAGAVITAAGLPASAHEGECPFEPLELTLPWAPPVRSTGALFPLSSIPAYDSLPGVYARLYLEFAGETNYDWNGYHPGVTPAYDVDGDPTSFSELELQNIHEIWQRVSEKYSPFNINVTTVDPGALNRREAQKIVIGGDGRNGESTYWAGARYGGVSFVSSFASYNLPRISYVFPGNLGNGDPKIVAEASAHEAGHALTLLHQSVYNAEHQKIIEYNPGSAERAPIMGKSYFAQRGLWWTGSNSIFYDQYQDDVRAISGIANEFGLRADDHGDDAEDADPLTLHGINARGAGVIENVDDVDYFRFSSDGGLASFTVDPFSPGGMLDASLALYADDGMLIATSRTANLSESLSAMLTPGSYDLVVSGAGNYGDLGQYTVWGTTVPEPGAAALMGVAILSLRVRRRIVRKRR